MALSAVFLSFALLLAVVMAVTTAARRLGRSMSLGQGMQDVDADPLSGEFEVEDMVRNRQVRNQTRLEIERNQ